MGQDAQLPERLEGILSQNQPSLYIERYPFDYYPEQQWVAPIHKKELDKNNIIIEFKDESGRQVKYYQGIPVDYVPELAKYLGTDTSFSDIKRSVEEALQGRGGNKTIMFAKTLLENAKKRWTEHLKKPSSSGVNFAEIEEQFGVMYDTNR